MFTAGHTKIAGRQVGTQNKFTTTFREAIHIVYHDLGGHKAFLKWARSHKSDFYKIASRLIPIELRTEDNQKIVVVVNRDPLPQIVEHQPILSQSQPALDVPHSEEK